MEEDMGLTNGTDGWLTHKNRCTNIEPGNWYTFLKKYTKELC